MKRSIIYPTLALGLVSSLGILDMTKHRHIRSQPNTPNQITYVPIRETQTIQVLTNETLESKVSQSHNTPYADLIRQASSKYHIPFNILDSLICQESSYNTNAISNKGAEGLMQLMPKTARDLGVEDPSNPEQAIDAGAHYLAKMFRTFGKSPKPLTEQWKFALASYNAGPKNVIKAQETAKLNGLNPNVWENVSQYVPKDETRDYVRIISEKSHLNGLFKN